MSKILNYLSRRDLLSENIFLLLIVLVSLAHVYFGLHLYGDGSSLLQVIISKQITFLATKDYRPISHLTNELLTYITIFLGVKNFKVISWIYGLSLYLIPFIFLRFLVVKFWNKYAVWICTNLFLIFFILPINKVSEIHIGLTFFWISLILFEEQRIRWGQLLALFAVFSHQAIMFGYVFWLIFQWINKKVNKQNIVTVILLFVLGMILSYSVRSSNARNFYYEMAISSLTNSDYLLHITLPIIFLILSYYYAVKNQGKDIAYLVFVLANLLWLFVPELNLFNYHYVIRPFAIVSIALISLISFFYGHLNRNYLWTLIFILVIQNIVITNSFINIIGDIQKETQIAKQKIIANNNSHILPKCPFIERTIIYYQAHYLGNIQNKLEYDCGFEWAKVNCEEVKVLTSMGIKNNVCR